MADNNSAEEVTDFPSVTSPALILPSVFTTNALLIMTQIKHMSREPDSIINSKFINVQKCQDMYCTSTNLISVLVCCESVISSELKWFLF